MARTLELLLRFEPVRCATQMGANGRKRIDAELIADQPYTSRLESFVNLSDLNFVGEACLESWGRFEQDVRKHETRSCCSRRQHRCCECRPCQLHPAQKFTPRNGYRAAFYSCSCGCFSRSSSGRRRNSMLDMWMHRCAAAIDR